MYYIYIYIYIYYSNFSEKNPVYRDRTHVPTCQKVTRLLPSYRGDRFDRLIAKMPNFYQSIKTAQLYSCHIIVKLGLLALFAFRSG